ncbi:4-hydroxy-tetrahydrodipicolinate reductase [Gemmatimonas sp.]|uniref:4-hydroxy-tetrahydrodipicolinate reductase n=1 Tax=Gemmatimonas sp. TaxID=1962908 RepID=UPI003983A8E8
MSVAPVRIALIGMGRMGRALDALAAERGCDVVARLDAAEMSNSITAAELNGAQVAIEFTTPESSVANAVALLHAGCPVVIGTTGWSAQLPELEAAAHRSQGAALWSPNFSIGVQLFLAMAEDAARRARHVSGFDTHVVETHHLAKLDAPSGTGIAISERLQAGLGRDVPITSVRTGSVPGTHEIIFDAPFEQIRLVHEARDRRVFADGALTAARWLAGARVPGVYTMRDVLASSQANS